MSHKQMGHLFRGTTMIDFSLTDSLARGGVVQHVSGQDRYEVLRQSVRALPLPAACDRDRLLDRLMSREKAGGTALGSGVAVPHPKFPVLLPGTDSIMQVCYLEQPLDYQASDRRLVDTLFLLICPDALEHMRLLSRLALALKSDRLRAVLATRPGHAELLTIVRETEADWVESRSPIGSVESRT